jgi:outer membrane protein
MRIITVLVAVTVTALQAQNPAQLSFEEAVKIGLERNVLLKQQKNQLEFNQVQKTAGYAAFLPNVNLTGSYQKQNGQQPNTTTGNLEDLSTTYFGTQVNAGVNLFNGLRGVNALGQVSNQLMAQSYLVKRTTQDVLSFVALQYLQVLQDQELLKIAEENLTAQKVLLSQMQGFFDVGTRAITDVYSQDALMKAAEVTYIRAKNTLQNDKSILAQTLQLDPAENFEVVYPEFKGDIRSFKNSSLDSLVQIAMTNRADLEQFRHQAKANQYQYKSFASGFLPSVSVFANYGSFFYSEIPVTYGEQFRTLNPSLSYGANFTIPIFGRFANKTQRMNAQVLFKNAELNRQNLERTVKLDVQRALNNLINAAENLDASNVQFRSGDLALKTREESYNLGISTQIELAQARQIFVQGASAKAQAEVTLIFNRILLDYSIGILKVEDLTGNN